MQRGKQLAEHGDEKSKIAACVNCHGLAEYRRSEDYPGLAGQPAWFISNQLILFSQRKRGGSDHASLMYPIADKLDNDDRRAIAAYYSSLAIGD